jgi:hypothetical protein
MKRYKDKTQDFSQQYQEEISTTVVDDYEEEEMLELEREGELVKKLDNDLLEYFSDAKVIKKNPKLTKKKKEKIVYEVGQKVKAKNVIGSILYGPYELANGKQMYEVETNDGNVISVEEKHLEKV